MTKAELIRKLARRNGVPDSEAKIFFEIFLIRASEILKLGEAVRLANFGYFQFKRGMIKNIFTLSGTDKNLAYADLMVFTPLSENEEQNDNLIFNVPSNREEDFHYVDLYFSLSIGKPVIPLSGVAESELFIPPTGMELKKLLQAKVEKLLNDVEIIDKHVKGSEFLLIDAERNNLNQFEFSWDNVLSENLLQSSKTEKRRDTNSDINNLEWNFGEDLSKQIEEEILLDTTKDSPAIIDYENTAGIEWNFGNPVEAESKDEELKDKIPADELLNEKDLKEDEKIISAEDRFSSEEYGKRITEEINNFEQVSPLTNEFSEQPQGFNVTKSERDLSWDFGKTIAKITAGKFQVENNNAANDEEFDKIESYIEKSETAEADDLLNDKTFRQAITEQEIEVPLKPQVFHEQQERTTKKKEEKSSTRVRSSLVFFIALAVILFVAVVLYGVVTKYNISDVFTFRKNAVNTKQNISKAEIIKRDYSVPVTFPYDKSESVNNIASGTISAKAFDNGSADSSQKNNLSSLLNPPGKTVEKSQNIDELKKVENNIYGAEGNYAVQVSSWQSKSIADKEAEEFKGKGYNAGIEKAVVPGRGVWYRVKVGGFKTLTDAQKFLNTNK